MHQCDYPHVKRRKPRQILVIAMVSLAALWPGPKDPLPS
jgi:hypothetical protein